jgi:hypothetical protein
VLLSCTDSHFFRTVGWLGAFFSSFFPFSHPVNPLPQVPVFVRALIGLIWLVVLTFQAADVVTLCISAVVPSYNTAIPNRFPASSNVTSQQLLSMFI